MTIFSRIINGEIPCHKIAESEQFIAFLDIQPLTEGHTLVVPKVETDELFDLPEELLADMIVFSRQIAKALKSSVPCLRIGVAVLGMEVPHAHIHLVPLSRESDLDFKKERLQFSTDEMAKIAARIREHLALS